MNIREDIISKCAIDGKLGRIKIGSIDVAYHCDKFNTRIIKGFEDTLGYEKARDMIHKTSEETLLDAVSDYIKSSTSGMSPADVMKTIFEMFKTLGYGSFTVESDNDNSGKVNGSPVYTAEGWLENEVKYNWEARKNPVCHTEAGFIAAAWEIAHNLPKGSTKVTETTCRSMGANACEFTVEVK